MMIAPRGRVSQQGLLPLTKRLPKTEADKPTVLVAEVPSLADSAEAAVFKMTALRAHDPTATKPGLRKHSWLWSGGAGLALIVDGLTWWQPWSAEVTLVTTETITPGMVSRVLAVNGRIAALDSVGVRSSVPGQLTEVLVADGDTVLSGAVIARLDSSQPRAQVMQALAAFDASIVQQKQAQADADRALTLGGNVPRKTMEAADLAALTVENEVERLRAALAQAQSQLTL